MRYDEEYPFDPEPRTQREYKRNFLGMPSRFEWNGHPMRKQENECHSCGYRYPDFELNQEGHNGRCWNCFMCETQPHQVRNFWDRVDKNNGKCDQEAPKGGTGLRKAKGQP